MREKPKTIALRITEAEYQALKQLATKNGVASMSEVVRTWIQPKLTLAVNQTTNQERNQ